jgi:hypothetical protein
VGHFQKKNCATAINRLSKAALQARPLSHLVPHTRAVYDYRMVISS